MHRIQVRLIDGWVSEFLRRERYPNTIVYEDSSREYKDIWSQALTLTPSIGFPDSFYKEEWERVILTQQVNTRQKYFNASRAGRGVALNRKQRDEIWPVFEEVRSRMHYAGLNQNVVPLRIAASNSEDPVELRQNELNERALVHVAASRAVKGLFVSWHGNVSPFLTGLN